MSDTITLEGYPELVSPSGNEFAHVSIGGVNYKIKLSNMGIGTGIPQLSTPALIASVISSSRIDLSWTNVANESSYKLEWSPNGTSGWTQIGGTIAANITTYSHTGLSASTHYYYRVSAVGDGVSFATSGFGYDDDTTSAGGGIDSDAATLIAAIEASGTAISGTDEGHISTLFASIKAETGLYSAIDAAYILWGTTSGAQKWDLKNPLNTDGARRLTYNMSGSLVFSNGFVATANFADANADTHYDADADATANDNHLGFFAMTDEAGGGGSIGYAMGSIENSTNTGIRLSINTSAAQFVSGSYSGPDTSASVSSPANTKGFWLGTRTGATTNKLYRNGTEVGSNSTSDSVGKGATGCGNILILATDRNGAGGWQGTDQRCGFATIGKGLTASQVTAYYNAVNTFFTNIGRS